MNNKVRIPVADMTAATDADQERNIYVHPNPLARDIFWQRLDALHDLLARHAVSGGNLLDFGGGSGGFVKGLHDLFPEFDLVDLDPSDARRLAAHLGLSGINIIETDISGYSPDKLYDTVVLADVLEHFQDLSLPVGWLRKHVRPQTGQLFVSLPTENWIYELGRRIVNKQKPEDHYHKSAEVMHYLKEQGFEIVERHCRPRYLLPIPLFEIAVLRYAGPQDAHGT